MSPPEPPWLELRIDSRLDAVAMASTAVAALARLGGFDEQTCFEIDTCVTEAVNNVILHAYGNRAGARVELRVGLATDALLIEVRDRGKPLAEVPKGELPDDPCAESGRGWFILRQWMTGLDYASQDGINTLRMRRARDHTAPARCS